MSLADALTDELAAKKSQGCGVGKLLGALPKPDRAALLEAMVNPAYTAPAITRALAAEGHKVSNFTMRAHRRSDCPCPKASA